MSFAMECIRAHIFVAVEYKEPQLKAVKEDTQESRKEPEGGMTLCSQS